MHEILIIFLVIYETITFLIILKKYVLVEIVTLLIAGRIEGVK